MVAELVNGRESVMDQESVGPGGAFRLSGRVLVLRSTAIVIRVLDRGGRVLGSQIVASGV